MQRKLQGDKARWSVSIEPKKVNASWMRWQCKYIANVYFHPDPLRLCQGNIDFDLRVEISASGILLKGTM